MPTTDTLEAPTLFDLATGLDEPRARKSDPVTSHMAADRSQSDIHAVKAAVLALVRQEQPITGSEANRLYQLRQKRNGWPPVAWDSPRKRMGDMHRAGLLAVVNEDAPRGTEREYREAL